MNLIKNDRRQTGISSIELIICTLVDQEAKITLMMMKSKCNRTDMSLKWSTALNVNMHVILVQLSADLIHLHPTKKLH